MKKSPTLKALLIAFLIGLPSFAPIALTRGELFPDSSFYLDAGRNLFLGRGFATKINLSVQWPGKGPQEAISYYNPLFMILSGLFWYIFRSVQATVFFMGSLVAIFNGWLIFLIARKLLGEKVAWFSMVLFLLSPLVRHDSSEILAIEQAGLATGLLAVLALSNADKGKRYLIYAGISMAIGFFLQVASLFNSLLIGLSFLVWRGLNKKGFFESILVATTVAIIIGGYEIFCYFKTGNIYPIYPAGAKVWSQSRYFVGAEYHNEFPALRFPELDPAFKVLLAYRTFSFKFSKYIRELWDNLIWLLPIAPLTLIYFLIFKRKSPVWMLILPAFLNVPLFVLIYYWDPDIETHRYAVFPLAFMLAPTIYILERFINRLKSREELKSLATTLQSLLIIIFCIHLSVAWIYRITMFNTRNLMDKEVKTLFKWINSNSKEDQIVAVEPYSQLIALSFYVDRPVVQLPDRYALSNKNFQDFWEIFKPKFVGIKKVDDKVLKSLGRFQNNYDKRLLQVGCKKVDELKTRFFDIWECEN